MNLTLFDLDGTLIQGDSDHAFGEFLVQQGWADAAEFRKRNDAFLADYQAGCLDLPAYVAFATSAWRHAPAHEALELRRRFMAEVMLPLILEPAQSLVRRHQLGGDLVAIVTATNEFVTEPIAQAFGVEHLIALRLERDEARRVTGAILGTPTFREGKIARVLDWLRSLGHESGGQSFERVTVYSDSINDLPLLEWATHPVATNPSPSLAQKAGERGWPILHLFP